MIAFFTVTGRRLDLADPKPGDTCLDDIACALSKMCRYNGQIDAFYSVAQHACLVSEVVSPRLAFPALNHDDAEAYLGDMSSKLKHSPGMLWFRQLEQRWHEVIMHNIGCQLTPEEEREIKAADDLVAIYERVTLRYRREFHVSDIQRALDQQWVSASSQESMVALTHRLPKFLTPLSHEAARHQFINRYMVTAVRWSDHARI